MIMLKTVLLILFFSYCRFDSTSLEECTYIVNGSDTFGGEDSALDMTTLNEPCILSNHIHSTRNWYGYAAKFRMRAQFSRFYYRIVYPEEDCCLKMLLYLEPQVDNLRYHMSCMQMQSVLDPTSPQVITLSPNSPESGCKFNVTADGDRVVDCFSGRKFKSDIERNWYVAISSCGLPRGLNFEFTMYIYGWVESKEGDCPNTAYLIDGAPSLHRVQGDRLMVLLLWVFFSASSFVLPQLNVHWTL
jgi:hypothetical protein